MAHLTAHNIDARHSTFNNPGRDFIHNIYYNVPVASAPSSSQAPQPLSFNDAPIDLLSSYFTGRNDDLEHVGNLLGVNYGDTPTRCAVYGMQGIGKTQLGLQYAKLSYDQQRYSVVFWIPGATIGKLNQGLAGVLTLIGHPDRDHQDQNSRLTAVRHWLEGCAIRWLLILDNVAQEAVSFLREHLPRRNSNGNILLTARTRVVAEAVARVAGQQHSIFELRPMGLNDATTLLLREAGMHTDPTSAATSGANDLVKCLGSLPLAISHAASFAKQSGKNLADVVGIYKSKHKYDLISWENNLSGYEHKSVAATFGTQLEELERQSPDFSNLLKVLSFLDPESIPLNMITEGAEASQLQSASCSNVTATSSELLHKMSWHRQRGEPTALKDGPDNTTSLPFVNVKPEPLIDLLRSPVQLQRAIQHLHSRSLVGYESNGDEFVLHIHDLIQLTIQESTRSSRSSDADHHWFHVAVELVCSGFRQIDDPESYTCWDQCEVFAPHIQSLTKWDIEHSVGNSDLDDVNIGIAMYLRSRGRYGEAEMLLVRVLARKEKVLGPKHLDTSLVADILAEVYWRQGRYNEAETLFRRALASREKLLGLEHADTLQTVQGLAIVYWEQKHYKDAETMYLRAIKGREKHLGPDHLDTLNTVEGLATVYANLGEYGKAEMLFKRVLAGKEKHLGPDHPDLLQTVGNLSSVYFSLRRYDVAEILSMRALGGKEKSLGPDHPSTLVSVANLARLYHSQGRYNEAEALYRRALTGQEKVFGPEHPNTLLTVHNFAIFFKWQRRYEEEILLRNCFPQAFGSQ